ncbi:MAG: glycosyltransferase family 9 protein [Pseudomonadota bacterium]
MPLLYPTILVISNGELIGDGLVKLPFIRALRREFPASHITWLTRNGCVYANVLKDIASSSIDSVITHTRLGSSLSHIVRPIIRPVQKQFDLIINPELRWNRTLAAYRIPHGTFYSRFKNFALSDIKQRWSIPNRPPHVLGDLMWLLSNLLERDIEPDHSPINVPAEYRALAETLIPEDTRPTIGLAPGSGGRNKCWPLASYIALGQKLLQNGFIPAYLIGPQELEWHPIIRDAVPNALFPLQATADRSVYVTLAVARRLHVGVANDAGGAHLMATAKELPLIVLYGPTPSTEFVPNTQHFHPLSIHELGHLSLDQLPVNTVYKQIKLCLQASSIV